MNPSVNCSHLRSVDDFESWSRGHQTAIYHTLTDRTWRHIQRCAQSLPHGIRFMQGSVQLASLDHAIWFHRPFRLDEWLLYAMESPNAAGARGLAFGRFFSRDGALVASTAQEGLVRVWD